MNSPTTNNEALAETKEMDWPHMDRSVPLLVPQNQNPISPQLADAVIRLFLIIPKLWSDKFKVKSPADLLEEKKKQPEFIDWLQKAKLQLAGKKLKRVIE